MPKIFGDLFADIEKARFSYMFVFFPVDFVYATADIIARFHILFFCFLFFWYEIESYIFVAVNDYVDAKKTTGR